MSPISRKLPSESLLLLPSSCCCFLLTSPALGVPGIHACISLSTLTLLVFVFHVKDLKVTCVVVSWNQALHQLPLPGCPDSMPHPQPVLNTGPFQCNSTPPFYPKHQSQNPHQSSQDLPGLYSCPADDLSSVSNHSSHPELPPLLHSALSVPST